MASTTTGREGMWTPQIWSDIDRAVTADVGRVRVAQKSSRRNKSRARTTSRRTFSPWATTPGDPLMIQEGVTLPFLEISAKFALTQSQMNNEANLRTAQTLAQLSARRVALAEDLLFFQGAKAEPAARCECRQFPRRLGRAAQHRGHAETDRGSAAAKRRLWREYVQRSQPRHQRADRRWSPRPVCASPRNRHLRGHPCSGAQHARDDIRPHQPSGGGPLLRNGHAAGSHGLCSSRSAATRRPFTSPKTSSRSPIGRIRSATTASASTSAYRSWRVSRMPSSSCCSRVLTREIARQQA